MMKGGHGQTNQLHNINWDALYHTSHAQNLYMYVLYSDERTIKYYNSTA